ncbi:MAG: BON domain-containing protein [Desulfobacteraceae bacterium]|nr:MAG: BON domain-containing protein [Desulfobacteraceae bacterium]
MELNPHMLDVEVSGKGIVHLSGMIHSQDEKDRLLRVVGQISGIRDLKTDIGIMPPAIS